jgi:hypothetical protein
MLTQRMAIDRGEVEIFISGLAGAAIGLVVGAFFKPVSAWGEKFARRIWSQDPIIVAVERDPAIIWSGEPDWIPFSVYIDDPIRLSSSMPSDRTGWLEQMHNLNAVDAFETPLRVTVQARTDAAVVIEQIRVTRHRQVKLGKGIIVTRPTGGADLIPRRFEVQLDWGAEPLITFYDPGGEQPTHPPAFNLAAGEAERFHLCGITSREQTGDAVWHEWSLDVDLLVEGRKVVRRIDNNGRPFVTVSPGGLPHAWMTNGSIEWTNKPPWQSD